MLTISLDDVLLLAALWLVCGLVSALVFIRFAVLRYAGKAVVNALMSPDDDVRAAISALMGIILTSQVATGKKITDSDGHERDEALPFVRYIGREVSNYLGQLRKASNGGKTTQVADELGGLLPMGPRKGQSTSEFLLEQAMVRMGPKLEEIITKKVQDAVTGGQSF